MKIWRYFPVNCSIRSLKLIFLLLILFIILSLKILSNLNESNDQDAELVNEIHARRLKAVQLLTERFHYKNWGIGTLGEKPFEPCPEKRCYAFKNQLFTQRPVESADGVIVHSQNIFYVSSKSDFKRNRRQLWLYYTMESQAYSFCSAYYDIHDLDDLFNITATFKPQSNVLTEYRFFNDWDSLPYYEPYYIYFNDLYLKDPRFFEKTLNHVKKHKILWFVSHCSTLSQREAYVNELKKHIDVDVYGKCKSLHSKDDPCNRFKDKRSCIEELFQEYKFYLAFENSNCDNYITEKYWQFYSPEWLFRMNVIPIVRGARYDQYLKVAPSKRSFIHTDSFKSPNDLAKYLDYLDKNETAFREYFEWKTIQFSNFENFRNLMKSSKSNVTFKKPMYNDFSIFCDICSKLHNETYLNSSHTVKISEFFNPQLDCTHKEHFSLNSLLKYIGVCA